ncbi:MAG: dTDP-4-dehydrorhamnose reductase [Desulfobulbaceae bacterium A2]|nr:MAG: dTDP-4-dehydrorhamnose reductase [Desulfobulbaceae bacterium A2]
MRILLTGGRGQLGHDLRELLAERHEISAPTSAELDLADAAQLRQWTRRLRPELVLNCGAYTAVDACEGELDRCLAVNGVAPGVLAEECAGLGARLIHISTDYVFAGDRPVPRPYDEDDPVAPASAYGRSKLAGEEAVRRALDNHLIVRTAWLYGIAGKNFLKTMLRLALKPPAAGVRVVDDQYGSLTWSWRLARQLEALLKSPLTGTVHATAQGHSSWYQGAGCFLAAMGLPRDFRPCATADYPTPARRPANSILDNRRLRQAGLDLMQPWDDDVREFARRHHDTLLAEARSLLGM